MLTIFRLYRCGDIIRVIILSEIFMAFLNYNKDEKLEFNYKRACADGNRAAFFPVLFCAWKINDISRSYLRH